MSQKQAYQEKMEAQLKEWGAKIDELKAKAEKAEADAKLEYHKRIDGLQAKRNAAEAKLAEVKASGEETWENLKEGVEGAWNEFKSAVSDAVSKFK